MKNDKVDCDVIEVIGSILLWVVLNTTAVVLGGAWIYILWNHDELYTSYSDQVLNWIIYGCVVWVITVLIMFSREVWVYVRCGEENRSQYICSLIEKTTKAWDIFFGGLLFPVLIINYVVKCLHWFLMKSYDRRKMRMGKYNWLL